MLGRLFKSVFWLGFFVCFNQIHASRALQSRKPMPMPDRQKQIAAHQAQQARIAADRKARNETFLKGRAEMAQKIREQRAAQSALRAKLAAERNARHVAAQKIIPIVQAKPAAAPVVNQLPAEPVCYRCFNRCGTRESCGCKETQSSFEAQHSADKYFK